jgi:RimJ/RimL family protein N-acetyltransferase
VQGNAIGMIRFDVADLVATISINIAPEHRQRGLGTALILVACHQAMASSAATQIRALIKPDNVASQRAFQRAGFKPADDEDVAGQRALCMVLN